MKFRVGIGGINIKILIDLYVCAYIHYLCPSRGLRTNDTLLAISLSSVQILIPKYPYSTTRHLGSLNKEMIPEERQENAR